MSGDKRGKKVRRVTGAIHTFTLITRVTGRIVSLTFRSDHLDEHGRKLLRPTPDENPHPYGDATSFFEKPEWL